MSATARCCDGVDKVGSEEITREAGESLLPALRKLPGFSGCYVFDDGEGILASIGQSTTRRMPSGQRSRMAPRTSVHETSAIQKPILRTVQGGFS
jgi:hypothetical protein